MSQSTFICPCCGFNGLTSAPYSEMHEVEVSATSKVEPPYSRVYGMPSYDVCDCCGYEFGHDDEPGTTDPVSFETYRQEWIRNGCRWFYSNKKPDGWVLEKQLQNLGITSAEEEKEEE